MTLSLASRESLFSFCDTVLLWFFMVPVGIFEVVKVIGKVIGKAFFFFYLILSNRLVIRDLSFVFQQVEP